MKKIAKNDAQTQRCPHISHILSLYYRLHNFSGASRIRNAICAIVDVVNRSQQICILIFALIRINCNSGDSRRRYDCPHCNRLRQHNLG